VIRRARPPSRACPGRPAVTKTGEFSNVTSAENCSATHKAKLSLPRIDKLQRAAIKPTGFALIVIRRVFDEVRGKSDRERTAQKQADPSVAAAEEAARLAAIEAEKAAREAERERLRQACRDLAEDPKLMERLEAVVRRLGVVGEAANISGAYLVATSRLLEKNALSLLRRGAAAGGKNFLLTNVVTLLPESEVIQLSGVSATALVYFGEDEDALQHKLIVVVEAAILAERSNGDENPALVLLRSLLSEGSIDRMVTVPQRDGPPKAIRVRRKGPVAVMMTSARDNVESEMLTRLLVCDADESPEQSERVLTRKLNQGEQLAVVAEEEIERWRDLQRWLTLERPYRVAIPFEKVIHEAYIDLVRRHREILQQLRIRRDISGLIGGIQASATLHKAQRQVDPQGAIVATIDDYRNAWLAFNTGVSSIYGTRVRKEIIALVKVAEDMGAELYDEGQSHGVGSDNPSVEITSAALRQALGVGSNKTASRRLQEALELGLLKQDHDRTNRGRATARAFWLLKTSIALRATDGPNVFPLPEDVKKLFEEGGRVVVPVHGVHGVHAQAEGGASVDTVDTVDRDNPEPPHQENFFNSWSEVDGVTVIYSVTYDEAEALIREILAAAAGKPIALDIETRPLASERERLKALEEERAAVNAEAIAFWRGAKKASTPQAEIDAHTETADARLRALDARIDHAESAGLDPNRSEIRLVQVYGGGARAAVIDIAKAGAGVLGLLQGLSAVIHGSTFDLAHLGHRGVSLGRVHDTQQAARLALGASKCSLAATVKHYLKVDLSKELQASDWASPELSEDQIRYAARDVIWLWRACPLLFKDLAPQVSAYRIQVAAAAAIARMNTAGIGIDLRCARRHAARARGAGRDRMRRLSRRLPQDGPAGPGREGPEKPERDRGCA
jgi:ribonuclease D